MTQRTTVSMALTRAILQVILLAAIAVPTALAVEFLVFSLTQLKSTVSTATISALATLVINCVLSIIFPRWMRWPSQLATGRQDLGNPETYHKGGDDQQKETRK